MIREQTTKKIQNSSYPAWKRSNSENLMLLYRDAPKTAEISEVPAIQKAPVPQADYGYAYNTIGDEEILSGLDNIRAPSLIRTNRHNANGFQLGWGSLVGFTSAPGGGNFTFNTLRVHGMPGTGGIPINAGSAYAGFGTPLPAPATYLLGNAGGPGGVIAGVAATGTQIVTRGVSSCTVISISLNNQHVMAHLDASHLRPENMTFITTQVPTPPAGPVVHPDIFISLENTPPDYKPATFARQLIENYYHLPAAGPPVAPVNLGAYLTAGVPGGHHIRYIDRTVGTNMFAHPEIGMSVSPAGQIDAFGSMRGSAFNYRRQHISTSERAFTQGIVNPQNQFDELSHRGQNRQHAADTLIRIYNFFHH